MSEPLMSSVVKLPENKPVEKKVFLSHEHPVPSRDERTYDLDRVTGVLKVTPKTGLPALQTRDLREIQQKKIMAQAMLQRREALAKAKAARVQAKAARKGGKKKSR